MLSIAIANQKGGVGKTTVTLGLAQSALHFGAKVLVVDCDPQANATAGLGISFSSNQKHLGDILENEIMLNAENYKDYVLRSPWSNSSENGLIDVICSHSRLSYVETQIATDPIGSHDRLFNSIKKLGNIYDLVLFDCPPSIGLLTINALFACDEVIVVSAPSAWSLDGVESFIRNIDRIALRRDGKPTIAGIVVNNVGRTRDGKYWEAEIQTRFSHKVVSVAQRAAIAEASAMSDTLRLLGSRPGAIQAVENFDEVYLSLIGLEGISDSDDEEKQMLSEV